ncbi:unnamed protein product [Ectocarpus sp. 12 AP-2014]
MREKGFARWVESQGATAGVHGGRCGVHHRIPVSGTRSMWCVRIWKPRGSVRRLFDRRLSRLFVFANRYKCERCVEYNGTVEESEQRPTSFNAWDVGCLERLPDYVSKEFPFILTRRSGIDTRLVDRLADDLVHGKGFSAAAKYIRQAHTTKFMVNQRKYVSLADARRSSRVRLFGAAPVPE